MKKRYLTIIIIIVLLLCSCASSETPTSFIPLDISDSYSLIKGTRPNTFLKFPEQDGSYNSIAKTMGAYKDFGEEWFEYALRLEEYIEEVLIPQLTLEGSEI